jgi:hypothetical protein
MFTITANPLPMAMEDRPAVTGRWVLRKNRSEKAEPVPRPSRHKSRVNLIVRMSVREHSAGVWMYKGSFRPEAGLEPAPRALLPLRADR